MTSIRLEVRGSEQVGLKLSNLPNTVREKLREAVQEATARVQATAMNDKLSGQVLNVRTGTLKSSINPNVTESAAGVFGTVGTNVPYGRLHEYGFTGALSISQHVRMQTMVFGRAVSPFSVTVSAHSRNVNYPERSFLRTALQDNADTILTILRRAVKEALSA